MGFTELSTSLGEIPMGEELVGTILRGPDFEPVQGRVIIEEGTITAVEQAAVRNTDVILPAFVNAHTHIGDSIVKDAGAGLSLEELVAPPDGLKHRLLENADRAALVGAMTRTIRYMSKGGTATFVDFREGGKAGVEAIDSALDAAAVDVQAIVLARESTAAMAMADGFGASGANDADFTSHRTATRTANKLFGIHAGEVDASDIDPALSLEPDFLVHMVHANDDHLAAIASEDIPVAVCPRSNIRTGVGVPPIERLHDRTTVALGTDNVFLNGPTMFREMAAVSLLTDLDATTILRMATVGGAKLAQVECGILEPGRPARLQVLDGNSDNLVDSHDTVRSVVNRATVADVKRTVTAPS